MNWRSLFFLPFLLMAADEPPSMLDQAKAMTRKFHLETAKLPPPALSPQPDLCLNAASVWMTIDLAELSSPAFEELNEESLWDQLKEIGIQGVYLKGLKKGGLHRTGIEVDPKWGTQWADLAIKIQKKGIALIGDSVGATTGLSTDFGFALKNYVGYQGLYHLIEIDKKDWKLLPQVGRSKLFINVPWLSLQELHKKGYVPEQFSPYVKESSWNATGQIKCADGKVRRWIYLKEDLADPVIDWLNPSFAGSQIAAADALDSIYNLGQKLLWIDDAIGSSAKESQSLWIRKLGGGSILQTQSLPDEWKGAPTDLISDTLTRLALLHALIAEDAEALKIMYHFFLDEGIPLKRLVHSLQPFDAFSSDWSLFLQDPRKYFKYYDETLTGEALRIRLLKQDVAKLGGNFPSTWPTCCFSALGGQEIEKKRDELLRVHLLLAFFYAMQPGPFSFSPSDLLGLLKQQPLSLIGTNENSLYGSLSSQMKNNLSFARQLQKIISVRNDSGIKNGELIALPLTTQRSLFLAIHQIPETGMLQLLAVNFGQTPAEQTLDIPQFRQTTPIDLMTSLTEKKSLESSMLQLNLPPLSGKVIVFQPKYD